MERLDLLPLGAAPSASVYLARLAPRSVIAMRRALSRVAVLVARFPMLNGKPLGRLDLERVPWRALDAGRLAWLRELLSQRYAPASVRQALSAVRGVLATLGVLDEERMAATLVHVPKRALRPFEPTGHVRNDALRALRSCGLTMPSIVELPAEAWRVGGTRLLVRDHVVKVPDALGDYVDAWVRMRGAEPGPLFCKMTRRRVWATKPISRAMALKAVSERPESPPLRDENAEQ